MADITLKEVLVPGPSTTPRAASEPPLRPFDGTFHNFLGLLWIWCPSPSKIPPFREDQEISWHCPHQAKPASDSPQDFFPSVFLSSSNPIFLSPSLLFFENLGARKRGSGEN